VLACLVLQRDEPRNTSTAGFANGLYAGSMDALDRKATPRAGRQLSTIIWLIHVAFFRSSPIWIARFTARHIKDSYPTNKAIHRRVRSHKRKFSRLWRMIVRMVRRTKVAPIAPTMIRIRRRSLFKNACWNATDFSWSSLINVRVQLKVQWKCDWARGIYRHLSGSEHSN